MCALPLEVQSGGEVDHPGAVVDGEGGRRLGGAWRGEAVDDDAVGAVVWVAGVQAEDRRADRTRLGHFDVVRRTLELRTVVIGVSHQHLAAAAAAASTVVQYKVTGYSLAVRKQPHYYGNQLNQLRQMVQEDLAVASIARDVVV